MSRKFLILAMLAVLFFGANQMDAASESVEVADVSGDLVVEGVVTEDGSDAEGGETEKTEPESVSVEPNPFYKFNDAPWNIIFCDSPEGLKKELDDVWSNILALDEHLKCKGYKFSFRLQDDLKNCINKKLRLLFRRVLEFGSEENVRYLPLNFCQDCWNVEIYDAGKNFSLLECFFSRSEPFRRLKDSVVVAHRKVDALRVTEICSLKKVRAMDSSILQSSRSCFLQAIQDVLFVYRECIREEGLG